MAFVSEPVNDTEKNPGRRSWWAVLIAALASSRLALVLVLVVLVFCLIGVLIPQEGILTKSSLRWQEEHPALRAVLRPLGLFGVFSSWPFFVAIILLGVNTLTCTLLRIARKGGPAALWGPERVRLWGFLVLHLSLLGLLAGGFWSAAARMDGFILLTEGQQFNETHDGYLRLVEGPLRRESHLGFGVRLMKVHIEYADDRYPVDVFSEIEIFEEGRKVSDARVQINWPFTWRGMVITQDQTGYSPLIGIRDLVSGGAAGGWVALQTSGTASGPEYRDFVPLEFPRDAPGGEASPPGRERLMLTLYPGHRVEGEDLIKTGETPVNPILVVELEDATGAVTARGRLPMGEELTVGDYAISFPGLKRWSSFRIADDPGYLPVMISLWLGVAALVLRYGQDLWRWFGEESATARPIIHT